MEYPALATLYVLLHVKTAAAKRKSKSSLADDAVLKKLSGLHKKPVSPRR
jgi:hypothetical protein